MGGQNVIDKSIAKFKDFDIRDHSKPEKYIHISLIYCTAQQHLERQPQHIQTNIGQWLLSISTTCKLDQLVLDFHDQEKKKDVKLNEVCEGDVKQQS